MVFFYFSGFPIKIIFLYTSTELFKHYSTLARFLNSKDIQFNDVHRGIVIIMMSFLSQAPASMKSVLQSFWLLTVAFGDLIVVILASVLPAMGVVSQSNHRTDWVAKEFLSLYEKQFILRPGLNVAFYMHRIKY